MTMLDRTQAGTSLSCHSIDKLRQFDPVINCCCEKTA